MRDKRSTDKRAKRSGIKIEKNWAENGKMMQENERHRERERARERERGCL